MQRLEIAYLGSLIGGQPPMLTDHAAYWEINVKSCDDERYIEAVGYEEDGAALGQHVVPLALVRSASARPVKETGDTG